MKTAILLALSLCSVASLAATYSTKRLKTDDSNGLHVDIAYPVFTATLAPAKAANAAIAKWAKKSHDEIVKEFRKNGGHYERTATFSVGRATNSVISVEFNVSEYTGGAHGNMDFVVFNFGKTKRLALGDLFKPSSGYKQRVSDLIMQKLRKMDGADWVTSGEFKGPSSEQLNRFVIGKSGLTFLFAPYEVGPYSAGPFRVQLSMKELGADFISSFVK
jgi:hypothetical protein